MNPRDRSALEVDEALIRRLRIINCPPDAEQLEEMLRGKLSPDIINDLAKVFTELEEKHGTQRFNSLMPFGHGIFAEVESEEDLVDLWDQQIHYLLYRPLAPDHVWAQEIRELYPVAAIKGGDGAEANR